MADSKVGKPKLLVGDCWTITFERVSQRAIERPDNVFTWGGVTGNYEALEAAIQAMGGTIEQIVTYNADGLEIGDIRDVEICVPCESFDTPPSDTLAWSFLSGTRTSVWSKKWCDEVDYTEPRCFQARILCVGRDNGITPGSSSNTAGTRPDYIRYDWTFESKGVDINGAIVGAGQAIGGATGWTPQFTDDTGEAGKAGTDLSTWVPYLNSTHPQNGKYCTAFGSKPKPTWRYAKTTTVDPCHVAGDWKLCRTDLPEGTPEDETEYTIHPVLVESQIVKTWRYWKIEGDKKSLQYCTQNEDGTFSDTDAPTWQPYEGSDPQPIPADCYIPCDMKFGDPIAEDAGSNCNTELNDGCEIKPAVIDPDTFDVLEPAVAVTTNLLIALSICEDGSVNTYGYEVDAQGNAEPYELPDPNTDGLFFGDCDTLDAFPDPEPPCRPPGQYTGRTFCYENKGKFVLIEKQFNGSAGTVDVSADLGLPVGSVIATTDASLWTGGAATIMAASATVPVRFTTTGSQPVCIRVQHGGAIPTDGAMDGMIANDGTPYGFTGNITGDGTVSQSGNTYQVTSGTDNSQGGINWTSQGPATDASAFTTNGNPLNSVRFWLATFDCVELREWVSDCGEISGWYDGERQVNIDGLVESECCNKDDCCDDKKVTADEVKTMCAFRDGDPTNCSPENVVEFTRTITRCVIDGVFTDQTITDSINVEALGEDVIVMSCRRDADDNLLICEEKCYKYTPPKIVRPIKTATSVKGAIKAVKTLSVKSVIRRIANAVNKDGETTALPWKPCDVVRVTTCCQCGSTEPIESETTYDLFDPDAATYSPTDPIDYEAEIWFEVPCEPGIEIADAVPVAVNEVCFEVPTATTEKKVAYNVQDFDPGGLEVGDEACIESFVTVDGGIQSATLQPIPGFTFTQASQTADTISFKMCWTYDGTVPNNPLAADVVCPDGSTATITGDDFFIASGGGESLIQEFGGDVQRVAVKEFCYLGSPSTYQTADGEPFDATGLTKCDDEKLACLKDIKALLDCDKCPKAEPTATTQSDDNATVTFPVTATNEFKDHSTTVTLTDPTGCLADNPDARVSVRYEVDHEAGPYDTHRLYILVASAGIFTSQSASNTGGTTGGTNITIGYASGDPTANARNVRWVKLTATAADWRDGITFTTGFFGGTGGAFESIFSQKFEACDDIGSICEGCGDETAERNTDEVRRVAAIEINEKDIPAIAGKMEPEDFEKRLAEIEKQNAETNFWFKASRRPADEKKTAVQPIEDSND